MKRVKWAFVPLVAVLLSAANASASINEITLGDLLPNYVSTDFESASDGAISGTDSIFTGIGLSSASLAGTFTAGGDSLDSGEFGNALVSRNGGSLSGSAPGGSLDDVTTSSAFVFSVDGTATQFGFRVVDQVNNAMRLQTYRNGSLLDDVLFVNDGSFPRPIRFFESNVAFDEFRILSSENVSGFGIDDLGIGGRSNSAVPEPTTIAIWTAVSALGLIVGRRKMLRSSNN